MHREFTYTKERLLFLLEHLLEEDIRQAPRYLATDRAEEGFEKRAAIDFLIWFLGEAFPEGFSFRCDFDDLEQEYGEELAEIIAEGSGWSAGRVRDQSDDGRVVFVDFTR